MLTISREAGITRLRRVRARDVSVSSGSTRDQSYPSLVGAVGSLGVSKWLFVSAAALVVATSSACFASDEAQSGAAQGRDRLVVELVGAIDTVCELPEFPESIDLGRLDQRDTHQVDFVVNCNAPFAYQVTSQNGALKHATHEAPKGFADRLPYALRMYIPTDKGVIDDTCRSPRLREGGRPCRLSNSGDGISINQSARMTFSWDSAPATPGGSNRPLIAGEYSDVLTITLMAR